MFLNNLIVLVCNFCFSNSAYNKANIFLGLIEYELNSLLGASHLVDYISVHIRFDLERYLLNIICSYFKSLKFFRTVTGERLCGVISRKLLIKSQNQNIFQKFKLNRNLHKIPFKMMYNMSMLSHRFSNERWGSRPEPPSSLIL